MRYSNITIFHLTINHLPFFISGRSMIEIIYKMYKELVGIFLLFYI